MRISDWSSDVCSSDLGEVLIQTRVPEAPVMAALVANDREGFYAAEAAARRQAGAPPYGRFAALVISSEDVEVARGVAQRLGQKAPVADGLAIYGPAPDRKSVVEGKSVSFTVDPGGRRLIKKKKNIKLKNK